MSGCTGAHQVVLEGRERGGELVLRRREIWEPVRFFQVTVTLEDVEPGQTVTLGEGRATGEYEHGRFHPCDWWHGVRGTVTLITQSETAARAMFDLSLTCGHDPAGVLVGVFDFELKPHLADR